MFQQDLLKGRAIFLTGGGTGLGRSMALRFAELGARMFLVGRREEPLKEVCTEIHRAGGSAAYTTCDVRDYGAVEAAAEKAEQQFDRIDTVVNNAAGNFIARTEKLSPTAFSAAFAAERAAPTPPRRSSNLLSSPSASARLMSVACIVVLDDLDWCRALAIVIDDGPFGLRVGGQDL